ncbi:MAG: QueT transporter family protein [Ruminiclostridium sp.]|nr:QueT transporter family protein [Ruminiclostridium sp.]
MKRNNKALFITHAAIIAALYVVLTYFASMLGLSNGAIQIRFSEALTILPYFTPAAIPGLFIGCIISNLLAGAIVWDVVFGSLATLIGAVFTYLLRKKTRWLAPLPPIAANTIIVPLVLTYAYGVPDGLPYLALTVGIGEVISCGILGMLLLKCLEKHRNHIFGS